MIGAAANQGWKIALKKDGFLPFLKFVIVHNFRFIHFCQIFHFTLIDICDNFAVSET